MEPKSNNAVSPHGGIPGDLYTRIYAVLKNCPQFHSNDELFTVFGDERLLPWRMDLREASSVGARIDWTIDYFYNQNSASGDNALVLLLQVLSDRCDIQDSKHSELAELADELAASINLEKGRDGRSPPIEPSSQPEPNVDPERKSKVSVSVITKRTVTISELRGFLKLLDDVELKSLCLDHFPAVYDKFASGMRRDEKINLLLDYVRRRPKEAERLRELLVVSRESMTDIPETILVPAGPFWIGCVPGDSNAEPNEKPGREHFSEAFQIGRYPVTYHQYAQFIADSDHKPPRDWIRGQVPEKKDDHPVVYVSYDDALAYCNWLRQKTGKYYGLPTEEEWEKAARGLLPDKRIYPWGDDWDPSFCNTSEAGRQGTVPVYACEANDISPFGVVGMAGNVWEWTSSWYTRYPNSTHNSLRYGQEYRVVRGVSWRNAQKEARISCRGRYKPEIQRPYLGFRIVTF